MATEDNTETNVVNATGPVPWSAKRLNAVIGYVSSVAVACGVIMWSVFNTWLNVLAYRAGEDGDQAWGIAVLMVVLTCIIPFCLGLALLFKALGQAKKR